MKKWITTISSTALLLSSNMALAHPGHQGESMLADAGHAFSNTDYLLGITIACVVIYQLIKRTD